MEKSHGQQSNIEVPESRGQEIKDLEKKLDDEILAIVRRIYTTAGTETEAEKLKDGLYKMLDLITGSYESHRYDLTIDVGGSPHVSFQERKMGLKLQAIEPGGEDTNSETLLKFAINPVELNNLLRIEMDLKEKNDFFKSHQQ